jgi:lipoate-protein ligase A
MAIDAAILQCAQPDAGPTLRLYRWAPATLSLGYFQQFTSRLTHPASLGLPIVRRASGGGAIIHDRELTYSLTIPDDSSVGASCEIYRQVHDAFRRVMSDWGIRLDRFGDLGLPARSVRCLADEPFLCFQRRSDEDLVLAGYKVVGSAQRRGRFALLQHGSLLTSASPAAPELPGIANLVGRNLDPAALIGPIAEELGQALGVQWTAGALSSREAETVVTIEHEKFGAESWTLKR